MSSSLTAKAFAKINLELRVLGVRPDGYHELRTVFQALALHDVVTCADRSGDFRIECDTPGVPLDASNLVFKAAQRLTTKPVKFGTVTPELVAFAVQDEHYKDIPERIWALSEAFNEELHDLADAGCQVIQLEEPQIHLLAARNYVDKVINPEFMLKVFNNTVKGLRAKTEVWCHTCWGNPSQQRMFGTIQSYKNALHLLNQVDADVITFESCSSQGMDLEAIGKEITDMTHKPGRGRIYDSITETIGVGAVASEFRLPATIAHVAWKATVVG